MMIGMAKSALKVPACPPKAPLSERPLLSATQSSDLARLFDVLASDTRLRLLHALVLLGDPCMGDLAEAVGMRPQAVSNQLRRLVDLGILSTRRHGTHIHYRIVDPCVTKLMHHGLCLNEETRPHAQADAS
jgi:DNA-binding transcriptional ArsR family regulator